MFFEMVLWPVKAFIMANSESGLKGNHEEEKNIRKKKEISSKTNERDKNNSKIIPILSNLNKWKSKKLKFDDTTEPYVYIRWGLFGKNDFQIWYAATVFLV